MPGTHSNSQEPQQFQFAEFALSTQPNALTKEGARVPLQPQPCRALSLLLDQAGKVVTREELRQHLWGADTFLNHEQGINFTIRRIRSALEDDPTQPRFIETVPRLGYRFIAPVERIIGPAAGGAQERPPASALRPRSRPLALGLVAVICLVSFAVFAARLSRSHAPPPTPSASEPRAAIPPHAYEAYLRGRYLLGQQGRDSIARAIAAFERTLTDAPDFAPAYAALASAQLRRRFTTPSAEVAPAVVAAARKALELDADLAEAHLALATAQLYFSLDWVAAKHDFQRALELDPNSARALHGYGLYLASLGRHDAAITSIRHAIALEPTAIYAISDLSLVYFWDRRYDATIAQARENLEARPADLRSLGLLVDAMIRKGDEEGTLVALNRIFAATDRPRADDLATALARSLEYMLEVDESGYHLDVEIATAWVDRGELDRAIERLRKACAERSDWMLPFVAVDPRFDALRSHADYSSLASCLAPRPQSDDWIAHLPG